MPSHFEKRLGRLTNCGQPLALHTGLKGLEKESLRVSPQGHIAQTPHPRGLGSALTHPYITTDYSEALLEFITPAFVEVEEAMGFLERIHRFVYRHLGDELLWATSMPCVVGGDESIPIAQYGTSNRGVMKHVYRRGLAWRYGRLMQAIAGVHFNYSLPLGFWPVYQALEGDRRLLHDFVNDAYFGLIRNFQRLGWLVPLLFGTSPAVCKSFLRGRSEGFAEFDAKTYYLPHATSLRMSDIGYKNRNQSGLHVCYNGVDDYVASLEHAISTPAPEYQAIGVKVDGEYRQLNANILQIENEYYSFVRPKQTTGPGEKPSLALKRRGVQYVEIRALDVSAYDPVGVNTGQLHFLEAFLVYCLLQDSPPVSLDEWRRINDNQTRVACCGRDPGLRIDLNGHEASPFEHAARILDAMGGVCELMDAGLGQQPYGRALAAQRQRLAEADALPSARMLREMAERGECFFEFALRMSRQHQEHFRGKPLESEWRARFEQAAAASLAEQSAIEAADDQSFDDYLQDYFAQA